jgi:hypothetical protein
MTITDDQLDTGMSIIDAIEHEHIFASLFREPAQWAAWFSFLRVLFGLPLIAGDLELFRQCTGRSESRGPYNEVWMACGRRAGKSFMMALIAVFLAVFRDYRRYLAPGERATVMIIAADRKQARVVMRYIRGMLELPALKPLVERETADSFDLVNMVTIEVGTASYKTVRGYTLVAALLDEIKYWGSGDNSTNPDDEILNAIRPAMVTIPGAMLICASNPHGKFGAMWKAFDRHYGNDASRTLVWKAPTRVMHPSIPQEIVDEAIADDPERARSEWLAEFRLDLAKFIDREIIEGLVARGRREEPPLPGRDYVAFVDPSGGASDSFVLAIAYSKDMPGDTGERVGVLACLREFHAPFAPDSVVAEMCATLHQYGLDRVTGDQYAKEWPPERFEVHGVTYEPSELCKNDIYINALPLLMQGRVELLDNPRLIAQICGLERRTHRGGRDSIDHPQRAGCHDDCANAALGALLLAAGKRSSGWVWEHL